MLRPTAAFDILRRKDSLILHLNYLTCLIFQNKFKYLQIVQNLRKYKLEKGLCEVYRT